MPVNEDGRRVPETNEERRGGRGGGNLGPDGSVIRTAPCRSGRLISVTGSGEALGVVGSDEKAPFMILSEHTVTNRPDPSTGDFLNS